MVPVELGRSEEPQSTGDAAVTLREFVAQYLLPSIADPVPLRLLPGEPSSQEAAQLRRRVGYLAQHPLFDQIPALLDDISPVVPGVGAKPKILNAWIGSSGTITSLHTDEDDNIFCQVLVAGLIVCGCIAPACQWPTNSLAGGWLQVCAAVCPTGSCAIVYRWLWLGRMQICAQQRQQSPYRALCGLFCRT